MKKIGFICFDNFQSLDLVGPMEVFAQANSYKAQQYKLHILSVDGGTVRASSGLEIHTQRLTSINPLDTLIVIGGNGVYAAIENKRLIQYVIKQANKARRIVSICSGVFMLAEAGLLNGKKVTTHWKVCDKFSRRYPEVELDPDAIFVRDGKVTTSAGVTAGMDLCLSLVEEDIDRGTAMSIARMLVIYYRRAGGQTQFSETLKTQTLGDKKFADLCSFIQDNPACDLSVPSLAGHIAMSERNFSRCFTLEVGMSPGKYVEKVRLESAKEHLENTHKNLDEISLRCGFSSSEILRRLFKRRHGIAPTEYRKRFGK